MGKLVDLKVAKSRTFIGDPTWNIIRKVKINGTEDQRSENIYSEDRFKKSTNTWIRKYNNYVHKTYPSSKCIFFIIVEG